MSPRPSPSEPGRLRGLSTLAFSGLAYLSFVLSFGILWFAFLADFPALPITVDRRPGATFPLPGAVLLDLVLILSFGLQHSVMARPRFKRWWTRWIPPTLERSVYVLSSSLALALLMALWQPIPGVVWDIDPPTIRILVRALFVAAMPLSVLASFQIDHLELLGLRQALAGARGRETPDPPGFVQPFLYRIVRHPIQLASLVMLWATPTLTRGHLLLSTAMTAYIGIGLAFEERDLVASIGERYREYRRRVPALIPRLGAPGWWILALVAGGTLAGAARGTVASTPGPGPTASGDLSLVSLDHDGRRRSVSFYRPARRSAEPALVLVLHGTGGSVERIRAFTGRGFERLADLHGFTVAYPLGFEGAWNGCRALSPRAANLFDLDDVGFLARIVENERRRTDLGDGQVHLFGFSGGGHLALRAALETPDTFQSAAVIAASLPHPASSDCEPRTRLHIPLLLVAGTEDPISPFGGGPVLAPDPAGPRYFGDVLPIRESAARLARWAGHVEPPRRTRVPELDGDPSTRVEIVDWSGPGVAPVRLVEIHGGGHTIPGPGVAFPEIAGRQTAEIDTVRLVRDFWRLREPARDGNVDPGATDRNRERTERDDDGREPTEEEAP